MQSDPSQERHYPVVLIGFLLALVAAGLLGVPTLLVLAGGAAVAATAILVFRGRLEAHRAPRERAAGPARPLARQYVPSVLEDGSMSRRRAVHGRRRQRHRETVRFR